MFEDESKLIDIGESAFKNCNNLKNISLPEGLKCIGNSCFYKCDLNKIVIPNSVMVMGDDAFAFCAGLKKVIF